MTYSQPDSGFQSGRFDLDYRFRPVSGLAIASSVLIILVLVAEALNDLAEWRTSGAVNKYGTGAGNPELRSAASFDLTAATLFLIASLAAGIVFLMWLWRARINAEQVGGPQSQRRSRGWTIGAWFCPIVNFWFPYQIVSDIWRASDPQRRTDAPGLVLGWWFLYLVQEVIGLAIFRNTFGATTTTADQLSSSAMAATVGTCVHAVSGVLLILAIRRITYWQNQPLPTGTVFPPSATDPGAF
jgi:hypothetical protein